MRRRGAARPRLFFRLRRLPGGTLVNSRFSHSSSSTVNAAVGSTGNFTYAAQTGVANFQVTSSAGLAVTNVVAPAAGNSWTGSFTLTAVGPPIQTLSINDTKVLTPTVSGGLPVLNFTCCQSNLVAPGGTYTIDISVNGDWSHQGTAANNVQLVDLNPAWTITRNFVFDSATNTTSFQAVDSNYAANLSSGLGINFFGSGLASGNSADVPFPAWALGLLALAAAAALLRNDHRRNASG